jgi:hypothetical protein
MTYKDEILTPLVGQEEEEKKEEEEKESEGKEPEGETVE